MENTDWGDFFTFQQDNAPAHRAGDTVKFLSRNTADFISPLPWPPNSPDLNPVDYEVWGMLQQRVYLRRIRDVDHLKHRLIEEWRLLRPEHHWPSTEQFDSGVFDYARSVQTVATLSTNCNWCFCVRTAKVTFPYWKLLFLSSIFKTAVAQKLCSEFCWNLQLLRRKDGN